MNDAARKSDMWSTWLERWAWLSLPGDALAVVLWDLPTLFAATLCSGVLAATFLVYRQARAWQPTEGSGSQLIRSVVRSTPRMTLVCLSTMALMTLSPSAGLGVIGLLTVTSPALHPVHRRLMALTQPPAHHMGRQTDDVGHAPDLLTLIPVDKVKAATTRELCMAWTHSGRALQLASVTERYYIITLRQRYLDELEGRNPAGFDLWLSAEAGDDFEDILLLPNDPPEPPQAA